MSTGSRYARNKRNYKKQYTNTYKKSDLYSNASAPVIAASILAAAGYGLRRRGRAGPGINFRGWPPLVE